MQVRALGWAGLEVTAGESTLVIDAIAGPGAVFERSFHGELVAPAGRVELALVTHLHRDHADVDLLARVLPEGAPVLAPPPADGPPLEIGAVAEAEAALAAAPLELHRLAPGDSFAHGPFEIAAVQASDGLGDPQVSWVVAASEERIVHCGDTLWHGGWWGIAMRHGPFACAFLPANGAVIDFPHRQPPADVPAVLTPEQAVEAARALGARRLVPIHHHGFAHPAFYRPREDAQAAVLEAAAARGLDVAPLAAGETMEVTWQPSAAGSPPSAAA